jgi:hypothetical protein
MTSISDLRVAQIRIYRPDELPFHELRARSDAIKEFFHFQTVQAEPLGNTVAFSNAIFEDDGQRIVIEVLSIEPRRIIIRAVGHSKHATAFHAGLLNAMDAIRPKGKSEPVVPLFETEESSCVATLEFDFEELLAPQLRELLSSESISSLLGTRFVKSHAVRFKSLSFSAKFSLADPALEEHAITLGEKSLTIEPRAGTPLSERRFFTASPTDSDTHMSLVEMLEREIVSSRRPA